MSDDESIKIIEDALQESGVCFWDKEHEAIEQIKKSIHIFEIIKKSKYQKKNMNH